MYVLRLEEIRWSNFAFMGFFRTALMAAAKKGNAETCECLLKKGADPSFTDAQGKHTVDKRFTKTMVY